MASKATGVIEVSSKVQERRLQRIEKRGATRFEESVPNASGGVEEKVKI